MNGLVCRQCKTELFPTPSSQSIRCHGCKKQFSGIGENQPTVNESSKCIPMAIHRTSANLSKEPAHFDRGLPIPPGKRALLCGVAYKGHRKSRLSGTFYDVTLMKRLLVEKFRFPETSIVILAEEEDYWPPTKRNIEEALKWLVKGCQAGDSLVFYFSGHGLRQPDFIQDERDGFDETICPVDFMKEGMIVDNYINETIVRPLQPGVKLHAIIDSCHSGTILDLACIYNAKVGKWEDNSPPSGTCKGTSGGQAICFSACGDDQLAADTNAFSGKQMAGAMTYNLIKAISRQQNITYRELLERTQEAIREAAQAKCLHSHLLTKIFHHGPPTQEPKLSASTEFDVNGQFNL